MPRLHPALIRQAATQNRYLPLLLRTCRDIGSAQNELRWLQEHARDSGKTRPRARPETRSSKSCTLRGGNQRPSDGAGAGSSKEDTRGSPESIYPSIPRPHANNKKRHRLWSISRTDKTSVRPSRLCGGQRSARRPKANLTHNHDHGRYQTLRMLARNVARRARGVPLQYILGSQPFGNLEILTHNKVLIPRPETETYTEHAARMILSWLHDTDTPTSSKAQSKPQGKPTPLRILDLCSGTGCIALLLHSLLKPSETYANASASAGSRNNIDLQIAGVDISPDAIRLSRKNLHHNVAQGFLHKDAVKEISFHQLDILSLAKLDKREMRRHLNRQVVKSYDYDSDTAVDSHANDYNEWDIIISNPPYISPEDFRPGGKTESSVRKYEPKLALVPSPPPAGSVVNTDRRSTTDLGDFFYRPLMDMMDGLGAKLLVMEVGDTEQAGRVHEEAMKRFDKIEEDALIESWKDDGTEGLLAGGQAHGHRTSSTTPSDNCNTSNNNNDSDNEISNNVPDRAIVIYAGVLAKWRLSRRWQSS
ncbi:hypothetical protein ABEF93_004090 [Exophiala dermatitidis]